MITPHRALSTRRRGSSRDGKNDPTRTFGIRSSTSPAGVDSSRDRGSVALVRAGLGPLVRRRADRCGELGVDQLLHPGLEQPAEQLLRVTVAEPASRSATRPSSSWVIAWFSSMSCLVASHQGSRDGPPTRWTARLPTPLHGTPTGLSELAGYRCAGCGAPTSQLCDGVGRPVGDAGVLRAREGARPARCWSRLARYLRAVDIIGRHLPPLPATVADVGGGPGRYTTWLAELGYHRPPPRSRATPRRAGRRCDRRTRTVDTAIGDATDLDLPDSCADAVLLLGPMYHLPSRSARLGALQEAARIVRPHGCVFVAAISRWARRISVLTERLYAQTPAFLDELGHVERTGDADHSSRARSTATPTDPRSCGPSSVPPA